MLTQATTRLDTLHPAHLLRAAEAVRLSLIAHHHMLDAAEITQRTLDTHQPIPTTQPHPYTIQISHRQDRNNLNRDAMRHLARLGQATTLDRRVQLTATLTLACPTLTTAGIEIATQLILDGTRPWAAIDGARLLDL